MKKIVLMLLVVVLLQGCSLSKGKEYNEQVLQYQSYYQTVLDNDKFSDSSPYFAIDAKIGKQGEQYVYEIIVDDPKIAMYDIKIMVVEDKKNYNAEDKMMPNAGIFEKEPYNMIPNQERVSENYMNGFKLLGEINQPKVNIQVIVSFTDNRKLNTYREFLEFDLEYEEPKKEDNKKDDKKDNKKEEKKDDKKDDKKD
ncbi:hypothetical protein ERUR111494_05875 [Erysipelothrix urinaevulpis]|uniref:hypothetical protein n=1 Tax=Erysipelothrix urinaevulpis TaxID=2683717 RepID=UPI00135B5953|nr:hypothetical protein [Erysipelothrix urinaevulpis]